MQGKLVLDIDPYNSRYTAIKQPITKQCHMIIDRHDMTYKMLKVALGSNTTTTAITLLHKHGRNT